MSNTAPDAEPAPDTFTVTVTTGGNGDGAVTSAPAGIDCGAVCSDDFEDGTSVTLTATPASGSTFVGWSGGGCSGTSTCVVTTTTATAAMFALDQTLMVEVDGTGDGTVTSAPAGISCGLDCEEIYAADTAVTLTATPALGSRFTGWSGGGCAGTGTCAVTMSAAVMVTATFTLETFTLTVTPEGNGMGSVTSTPIGIDCGGDCAEVYDYGTVVVLAAAPSTGSTFTGWSGGGCTGTTDCSTTIAAATEITATFTLTRHTLTVARNGNGTGSVSSSPGGIACPGDCSEDYDYGSMVTLTATASPGSVFAGWSLATCGGIGPCTVTVTVATTVTATFNSSVCDPFTSANGTAVPGWTERLGDWGIDNNQLRDTTQGSAYNNVITRDGSSQTDGCARLTAIHSGVGGVLSVGVVLRWSAPDSYVVALIQDNASNGTFNSWWIYQYPGTMYLAGGSGTNYGTSAIIEGCVTGTAVTLRVDANLDGTYEETLNATTTLSAAGLRGAMVLNPPANQARIDNFCLQ